MPHFFEKVPAWASVPTSDVPVVPFLQAARGLTEIFDVLGSLTLLPVKNDLLKNITTLEKAHLQAPTCRTVSQLLLAERTAGRAHGECAVTSYVWLVRGLEFISATFQRYAAHPTMELKVAFSEAYKTTLSKHHTWIQYGAFQMALAGIPTRAHFQTRLGNPPPAAVEAYFTALQTLTKALPV